MSTHQDRVEGFAEAMEAAGVADWRDYLLEDAHDVDKAERAVLALLAREPAPTAMFTTNNRITTGALRATGYRVTAGTRAATDPGKTDPGKSGAGKGSAGKSSAGKSSRPGHGADRLRRAGPR